MECYWPKHLRRQGRELDSSSGRGQQQGYLAEHGTVAVSLWVCLGRGRSNLRPQVCGQVRRASEGSASEPAQLRTELSPAPLVHLLLTLAILLVSSLWSTRQNMPVGSHQEAEATAATELPVGSGLIEPGAQLSEGGRRWAIAGPGDSRTGGQEAEGQEAGEGHQEDVQESERTLWSSGLSPRWSGSNATPAPGPVRVCLELRERGFIWTRGLDSRDPVETTAPH